MSLLKAFKSHNQIINIGQKTKQQSHSQNKMNASVLDKNLKWNIFSQIKVIDYKIILTFMQTVYIRVREHTYLLLSFYFVIYARTISRVVRSEVKAIISVCMSVYECVCFINIGYRIK